MPSNRPGALSYSIAALLWIFLDGVSANQEDLSRLRLQYRGPGDSPHSEFPTISRSSIIQAVFARIDDDDHFVMVDETTDSPKRYRINKPDFPFKVGEMAYFWSEQSVPVDKSPDPVPEQPETQFVVQSSNDRGNVSVPVHPLKATCREVFDASLSKALNDVELADGTLVSSLHWLCPLGHVCCEFECCEIVHASLTQFLNDYLFYILIVVIVATLSACHAFNKWYSARHDPIKASRLQRMTKREMYAKARIQSLEQEASVKAGLSRTTSIYSPVHRFAFREHEQLKRDVERPESTMPVKLTTTSSAPVFLQR